MSRLVSFGLAAVLGCCLPASADEPAKPKGDEGAILASVQSYVAAYNRGDAKAVAEHWIEEGEWISPQGQRLHGRKAIQQGLERLFQANRGVKLETPSPKIRLLCAEVAVEEGATQVTRPGQTPSTSTYLAIHVKRNGKWKLESVRETELPAPPQDNPLQELQWMVGQWLDASQESTVAMSVRWTGNQRFLCASFKLSAPGTEDLAGTQIIGWDPAAKTIRSWVFDSDGGFGEGEWSRQGNRWTVRLSMVLPDGSLASATNVYTLVNQDTYLWHSVGRQVDGHDLPNIEEVKVVRTSATPTETQSKGR